MFESLPCRCSKSSLYAGMALCVQTLRRAIPRSTLPVLPPAALPELVTSFLSSLEYFTSNPGLLSPKILTLSKFSLRSEPSSSATCSRRVAGACRNLQSVRCFRKLWGFLDKRHQRCTTFSLFRYGPDPSAGCWEALVNTGCCLLNKLQKVAASHSQARGILLSERVGDLRAVVFFVSSSSVASPDGTTWDGLIRTMPMDSALGGQWWKRRLWGDGRCSPSGARGGPRRWG